MIGIKDCSLLRGLCFFGGSICDISKEDWGLLSITIPYYCWYFCYYYSDDMVPSLGLNSGYVLVFFSSRLPWLNGFLSANMEELW